MIEFVYLVCWSFVPVATDCHTVRIEKTSIEECVESVNKMKGIAPSWCDTGREPKTIENWIKENEEQGEYI